jgi:hypothetical protein
MGKLVGILSSGIGLAIEAAAEYQSPNKSVGKRTKSNYQRDMTYGTTYLYSNRADTKSHFPGSRDVYSDELDDQRDAKAFQELQSYADFQRVLSNTIRDDISRDEKYTPINPQILAQGQAFGDYFPHQPYIHPSLRQSNPAGRLPCPVIIPQRRPEDKGRAWVRAYAPALMECGIDQYTFLNLLESFNESSKASSWSPLNEP